MNLHTEQRTLWQEIVEAFVPTRPVEVHEMSVAYTSTLHHLKQIERRREPRVESEVVRGATPMALIADEGRYVGLGHSIIRI